MSPRRKNSIAVSLFVFATAAIVHFFSIPVGVLVLAIFSFYFAGKVKDRKLRLFFSIIAINGIWIPLGLFELDALIYRNYYSQPSEGLWNAVEHVLESQYDRKGEPEFEFTKKKDLTPRSAKNDRMLLFGCSYLDYAKEGIPLENILADRMKNKFSVVSYSVSGSSTQYMLYRLLKEEQELKAERRVKLVVFNFIPNHVKRDASQQFRYPGAPYLLEEGDQWIAGPEPWTWRTIDFVAYNLSTGLGDLLQRVFQNKHQEITTEELHRSAAMLNTSFLQARKIWGEDVKFAVNAWPNDRKGFFQDVSLERWENEFFTNLDQRIIVLRYPDNDLSYDTSGHPDETARVKMADFLAKKILKFN